MTVFKSLCETLGSCLRAAVWASFSGRGAAGQQRPSPVPSPSISCWMQKYPWRCFELLPLAAEGWGGHKGQLTKQEFQTGCGEGGGNRDQLQQLMPGTAVEPPRSFVHRKKTCTCVCVTTCNPEPRAGGTTACPLLQSLLVSKSVQWLWISQKQPFVWGSFVQLPSKTLQVFLELWDFELWEGSATALVLSAVSVLCCGHGPGMHWGALGFCGCAIQLCSPRLRFPGRVCWVCWEWAQCVIHPWNTIVSVCAQNKGLAHNYMLLPGKSLADIDVWKTGRASSTADVAGKTELWRQFASEGWLMVMISSCFHIYCA